MKIFTNLRKRASGNPRCLFYFELFISFVHYFGIIIKAKCSPFIQVIVQQPIMSINKVITPMTKLSDPSSYFYKFHDEDQVRNINITVIHN